MVVDSQANDDDFRGLLLNSREDADEDLLALEERRDLSTFLSSLLPLVDLKVNSCELMVHLHQGDFRYTVFVHYGKNGKSYNRSYIEICP